MSLKDLFDKEKGVLHKAENRLANTEEDWKTKGDRHTAESLEKIFAYLDKNKETFDRLKPDFSRVYTRLGNHLDAAGHDTSAVTAYDRALGLDEENFDALNAKGDFLLERGMCEGALELFDRHAEVGGGRAQEPGVPGCPPGPGR